MIYFISDVCYNNLYSEVCPIGLYISMNYNRFHCVIVLGDVYGIS